jgi:hypothetical protein
LVGLVVHFVAEFNPLLHQFTLTAHPGFGMEEGKVVV